MAGLIHDCVGLLPAAGLGTRLGLGGASKELLAVPDIRAGSAPGAERPVCDYLLDQFIAAGINEVALLRRAAKTDLASHFASGSYDPLRIRDIVLEPTPGTAHTLLAGCRAVGERTVAFGFPDMVLSPPTLVRDALTALYASGADIAVSLIPPLDRANWDMAEFTAGTAPEVTARGQPARLTALHVRPGEGSSATTLPWGWCLAAWRPSFTTFLAAWLADAPVGYANGGEIAVGHVVAAAIEAGLHVAGAFEPDGYVLDIGTRAGLESARALVC